MNIKFHASLLVLVLMSSLAFVSCKLNFDINPEDVDLYVTVKKDPNCTGLESCRISCSAPYQTNYNIDFDSSSKSQYWLFVPGGLIPIEVFLYGDGHEFSYRTEIRKSWASGGRVSFKAVCDDPEGETDYILKPVLKYSLMKQIFVVNVTEDACNWFDRVELYEIQNGNPFEVDRDKIIQKRTVLYTRDPGATQPVLVLRLIDTVDGGAHDFRFNTDLAWSDRFDFNIMNCDIDEKTVNMKLVAGDLPPIDPDQELPTDGDADLDAETADMEDIDEDTQDADPVPDGDMDEVPEIDAEAEPELEEEDAVAPCGTVDPDLYAPWEAETLDPLGATDFVRFLQGESVPAEYAGIFDSDNGNISNGQYIRLDATGLSDSYNTELVFEVQVAKDYLYNFMIYYVGGDTDGDSPGWGIVELYLDDDEDPVPYNDNGHEENRIDLDFPCYYDECPFALVTHYPVCLRAGTSHRLRVRVVGTSSGGYRAGMDRIAIKSSDE